MAFDNTVTITGNITRDPELRYTPNGAAVVSFGLAWNRRWTNKSSGETEEQVSFFDVTAWNQLAENIGESLSKGMRVIINGRLEQRSWETNDGDRRSKVEIIADEVAPSLKWASATITKNERSDGGFNRSSSGGGGSSRPVSNEAPSGYDSDEEPF